ncbi:U3 small nucleolar ribonucleoprotein protein MPP10 [Ambystoma mexicanum]|uniref:U3 small nucleolar ribonucleoprotein protein MPP10 n=1 Tax=Ambystoma mexicanum TaxID=8296 RepID=UPI0037E9BFFE
MAMRRKGDPLQNCLKSLKGASACPDRFLSVQDGLASEFSLLTKTLYDFHKHEPSDAAGSPLKQLVIENFDEEQIWQQLELQNDAVLGFFKKAVGQIIKDKDVTLLNIADGEDDKPREDTGNDSDMENGESSEEESDQSSDGNLAKNDKILRKGKRKEATRYPSSDGDSDVDFNIDELEQKTKKSSKTLKRPSEKSVVDDTFFKLAEMEAYLDDVEKAANGKGKTDDDIDYFEDVISDDEEDNEDGNEDVLFGKMNKPLKSSRDLHYKDYFDPVDGQNVNGENEDEDDDDDEGDEKEDEQSEGDEEEDDDDDDDDDEHIDETMASKKAKEDFKKVTFDLSDESEGEELGDILGGKKHDPPEPKSSFEKRQDKMTEKIKDMEKDLLDEKSWQLKGEVTAQKRPENSLLEETLLFDHASRTAPVITEETTLHLEDIIKQRIKDQSWDDVLRKEKPKEDAFEYKKRLTLDHEKSKLSLAELYEQEYVKLNKEKTEEDENPKHVEIQKLMDSLFLKLDALSNFHFTPKPSVPEIKVVSNLPAIAMEEVAPVNISDAALLAPEEVKEKNKAGDLKADAEKTATDKKRERRKKKLVKRIKLREKEKRQKLLQKLKPEGVKKLSKKAAADNLKKLTKDGKTTLLTDTGKDKALKSSQAFFSQLQDQVKMQIKDVKNAQKKSKKQELSAQKLKL